MDVTIGVVLLPLATPPSDEYIVQIVVPVSYGWSGVSMGGQMANSLLFPFWPNGEDIVLGPRWAECAPFLICVLLTTNAALFCLQLTLAQQLRCSPPRR